MLRTLLKDDEVDYLCLDGYLPSVFLRSENLSLESMDIDFNIGKCFHTPITFKFVVSIADSIEQLSQNMPDDKITDEKKEATLANFVNRLNAYQYRPFKIVSDIPLLNGLFGFEYDRFSLEPITLNEQSKTTTLLGRYEKKG